MAPDDSKVFFEYLKKETELHWLGIGPQPASVGIGFEKGTRWRDGLSQFEIDEFQRLLRMKFPASLLHFYTCMNGLNKPVHNLVRSGNSDPKTLFYSYPEHLEDIKRILSETYGLFNINESQMKQKGISRLFPITFRRFMVIDVPPYPIISINETDVIYYADNLSKMLLKEVFNDDDPNYDENWEYYGDRVNFWLA